MNRVADRRAKPESILVIAGDVPNAVEHREHAGRLRWSALLMRKVGTVDDRGHPAKRRIAELVFLEHRLERASAIPVTQFRAADVESHSLDLIDVAGAWNELECRVQIDKSPDRPGSRDAVDVDVLAGDEVHGSRY